MVKERQQQSLEAANQRIQELAEDLTLARKQISGLNLSLKNSKNRVRVMQGELDVLWGENKELRQRNIALSDKEMQAEREFRIIRKKYYMRKKDIELIKEQARHANGEADT